MSSMEGLRGVAVLLVFFVHYSQLFGTALPNSSWTRSILFSAEQIGHSGVDLFFLLSGYLIYSVLASGKSTLWQFLVRRAQRIYPTFLVVFVIYAAIEFTQPDSKLPSGGTTLYLLKNLLLLPGVFAIRPLITVAWSLSYEIFYYLAIPALYHALRLRRWTPAARLLLFVAAAGGYAALCFLFWPVRIPALALNPFQHVRMIMFAAGIILYELLTAFRAGSRVRPAFDYLATAGVLLAFALILTNLRRQHFAVWDAAALFVAFSALAISCFGGAGFLAGAFSWTPLRWLGNISYSYYLVHAFVLHIVRLAMFRFIPAPSAAMIWLLLPAAFAATWIGATALFAMVEKPTAFAYHQRRTPARALQTAAN